jgi:hypothetical protein
LFFLTSLLHYDALVQDFVIQLVSDSSLGLLIVIFIQSAQIHPLLPVAEALGVVLCLRTEIRQRVEGLHSSSPNALDSDSDSADCLIEIRPPTLVGRLCEVDLEMGLGRRCATGLSGDSR